MVVQGRISTKAAQAVGRGSHVKLKVDDKDEHFWHLDAEQPPSQADWVLQKAGGAIDWSAPMVGRALIAAVFLACVWMVVRASLGAMVARALALSLSMSVTLSVTFSVYLCLPASLCVSVTLSVCQTCARAV